MPLGLSSPPLLVIITLTKIATFIYSLLWVLYLKLAYLVKSLVARKSKHVVIIVGGGFAATTVATVAQFWREDRLKVMLFSAHDYFEFTPSVARALVCPPTAHEIRVPLRSALCDRVDIRYGLVRHVQLESAPDGADGALPRDAVITVQPDLADDSVLRTVRVSDVVPDVESVTVVLATGSHYPSPFKSEGTDTRIIRSDELSSRASDLRVSESTVVVGGGLVGVEAAAELAQQYPSHRIDLYSASDRLGARMPPGASAHALRCLEDLGVTVHLGRRLGESELPKFHSALLATGAVPNINVVVEGPGVPEGLRELTGDRHTDGLVVADTMYLGGGVFAAGDCCAMRGERLAQNAELAAEVLAANLDHLISGHSFPLPHHYVDGADRIVVVSLGTEDGIALYGSWWMTGRIPALLKHIVQAWKLSWFSALQATINWLV